MMNHASSYNVIRLALGLGGSSSKRASHGWARGMSLAELVFLASVGKAEKTDRCHERDFKFTTTTSASAVIN
jgi:hypothetical protein